MTVSQATTVLTIDPTADPRWDQLVERHSAGWAYHLGDWTRILGGAYGFRSRCLGIVSGGDQLVGALPMMSSFGLVTGKRLRSLPIVVFSGSEDPRHKSHALQLGANAYYLKPGSFQHFTETVRHIIEHWAFADTPRQA